MSKVIAIMHARMASSRLPGKVLKQVGGNSVLFHHFERLSQCPRIEKIILATSKSPINQPLLEEAERIGIESYSGAEEDIAERYLTITDTENADVIVRCGCDKPLFSYEIVNDLLDQYAGEGVLYVATPVGKGVGSELISQSALKEINKHYHGPAITKYVHEYPHLFNYRGIEIDDELSRPEFRITLDTQEDLQLITLLYEKFYIPGKPVDLKKVLRFLDDHPYIANINRFVKEAEVNTYITDLQKKPVMTIYHCNDGQYLVKNRMEQIVPREELEHILDKIKEIPENISTK